MKRLVPFLFLLCVSLVSRAADLVISNNSVVCIFGDSWFRDGTSTPPQTGNMFPDYIAAAYYLMNPDKTNVVWYNLARGGGLVNDQITAAAQAAVPAMANQPGAQFFFGISQATENGNLTTNTMYLAQSNLFQAPLTTTNGTAMTNEGGWSASHTIQWIGLGSGVPDGVTGGGIAAQSHFSRNNASTNAGWTFGIRGIDSFGLLAPYWTNEVVAGREGTLYVTNNDTGKAGHLRATAELSWALAYWRSTTTDTNISTCTIDWDATIVATNHCVLSSASRSGNTLTFTRHDDRLPPAWDMPGTDPSGAVITNDCSAAYTEVNTNDANFFRFTLQITNLPAGSYLVKIDGTTVAASLSSTELAAGWNMFTNTVGPYWQQRSEVLGRYRDFEHADRSSLITQSAGDHIGIPAFTSDAFGFWGTDGLRGAALNTALASDVTRMQTNKIAIASAAQPTNHTFTVTLITPRFAPALGVTIERPVMGLVWNRGSNGYPQFEIFTSEDLNRPLQSWDLLAVTNETNYFVYRDGPKRFFAVAGIDPFGNWDWCSGPTKN